MSVPDDSTNIKRHEGKRNNITVVALAHIGQNPIGQVCMPPNNITIAPGSADTTAPPTYTPAELTNYIETPSYG